ncbi:MAG: discoidin domain-containing protein [Bacteroidota bacterium]
MKAFFIKKKGSCNSILGGKQGRFPLGYFRWISIISILLLSFLAVPNHSFTQVNFSNQSNLYPGDIYSGAPIGIADMNGDGKDDIVHLDGRVTLKISFQNAPGQIFTQQNYGQINSGSEWALCVADFDRNGINDILAGGAYNNIKLVSGNAQGQFTASLLSNSSIFVQGSNFVDINNDGSVDIFACSDESDSRKYRNNGNGNFTLDNSLINTESPGSDHSGNYSSIWTDYDNDGDLDMYLSKCRQGINSSADLRRINKLLQNDGNNVFTDVAATAGLRIGAQTWTSDFADIDNDGDMDAFVSNHGDDCKLYRNNGNGTFTDVTSGSGFLPTLQGSSSLEGIQAIFRDFDNDGYVDLLFAGTDHYLFYNDGDGTFTLASNPFNSFTIHSFAVGDLNHDGFLDIYAGHGRGFNSLGNDPDEIFMNNGNSNHFIAVQLEGTQSNINAIGARVEVYGPWGKQIREVRSGEGYGIMNTFTQHIGLGSNMQIDKVVVKWPSGLVDEVLNPAADQFLSITESGVVNTAPVATFIPSLTSGDAPLFLTLDATGSFDVDGDLLTYSWNFGDGNSASGPTVSHTFDDPGVYTVILDVNDGRVSSIADTVIVAIGEGDCIPQVIDTEDFELGWGIWNDGGDDATRTSDNTFANSGSYSIQLRDNSSTSFMTTDNLDLSAYSEVIVSFSYVANSFDSSAEDFWLQLSSNGGSSYTTVEEWNLGDEFQNNQRQNAFVTLSGPFATNTRFRIRCDATANGDQVFIDDVVITACAPIPNRAPTASFTFTPASGTTPLQVSFNASASSDPDGDNMTYSWDFGDGSTGSGLNPVHTYTSAENFTVTLTVSDGSLTDQDFASVAASDPYEFDLTHSVARKWNEVLLEAIRNDFARPTVHARNLHHISAAMFDAWSAYEEGSLQYFLGNTIQGFSIPFSGVPGVSDAVTAQEEAVSYAAYRLILHRFASSPGRDYIHGLANQLMQELGFSTGILGTNYQGGDPAELGNYLADRVIAYGQQDQSNESNDYVNTFYNPVNNFIEIARAGNPNLTNFNRWQPIAFDVFIDQAGNVVEAAVPEFLSPEWGVVSPFALTDADKQTRTRDGDTYHVYHDPGTPPQLGGSGDDLYKRAFSMVATWSSHLDPSDGVMWDISPSAIGNIDVSQLPTSFSGHDPFYDYLNGGVIGNGRTLNPRTNAPYQSQMVPRGDYARVLAEFWADGPDSETPPGHWFTILNYVRDHPQFSPKWKGQGPNLSDLEWDIKSYFTLGGTMHDAAITAWSAKGYYDYIRPVSAIRGMAEKGQSSNPSAVSYDLEGIPLVPGYIELVAAGDPLAGPGNTNVGKIKLKAWKGPNFILNPDTDVAGVDWILAEEWWPYQRPSFVTPPFAGYVSGHSTYSRAAAEVMTFMTGDEYFPGGMGEFNCPKDEFLVFENGPSVDVTLQWATYRDASDECSLSRIWGGIHPSLDDIPGRLMGIEVGVDAFAFSDSIISPVRTGTCGNLQNLALNQPSSQSSTYGNGLASYANDGNLSGSSPWSADLQHTTNEVQPWWEVDLGQLSDIEQVIIRNRNSGNQERLADFYILISASPFNPTEGLSDYLANGAISQTFFLGQASNVETINLPASGRYVRVQLSGSSILHMAEVEVLGCLSASDPCAGAQSVAITPAGPFLENAGPQQLQGSPASGSWSGSVSATGVFDPSQGPGSYTVTYTYTDGNGCTQSDSETITVNPIGGCSTTSNLALNQPSSQSSTYGNGVAGLANDGNLSGSSPWSADLQHTTNELNPWWEVDLRAFSQIDQVQIINRSEGGLDRLSNFYILVSAFSMQGMDLNTLLNDNSIEQIHFPGPAGTEAIFTTNITGRYVRVQLAANGILHMAEVKVMGCASGSDPCGGAPLVEITPAGPFVENVGPQQLQASPSGGSWSGAVSATGIFDPSQGVGTYTVSYTFDNGNGCIQTVTESITVNAIGGCSTTSNLALNQPATQSSTYGNGVAGLANDGNLTGSSPWSADLQHTTSEVNPWWEVDLGSFSQIDQIRVVNRSGAGLDRLSNFYVLVSASSMQGSDLSNLLNDNSIEQFHFPGTAGTEETFSTNSGGRYVRIQLGGSGILHMAEVEVQGCAGGSDPCQGAQPVRITSAGPFVEDAGVQALSASPIGGIWGGAANSTGAFDPSQGPGTYTVTYTYNNGSGCTQTDVENVTVTPAGSSCNTPSNLALNQPASQSSLYGEGVASIGVDGDTDGTRGPWGNASIIHTAREDQPWWQVDLGQLSEIQTVVIHNRTDCCQTRLGNFYVLTSNSPFPVGATLNDLLANGAIYSTFFTGTAGNLEQVSINAMGRYVRIQLSATAEILHVAEIEIQGCATGVQSARLGAAESTPGSSFLTREVSIFPNPANEVVTVQIEGIAREARVTYGLHTLTGQLVWNKQGGSQEKVNIQSLAKGIYLLKVQGTDWSEVKQLVVH